MSELFERYRNATVIYAEDECALDAEGVNHAYVRLFGTFMPDLKSAIAHEDLGDCELWEVHRDRFVCIGPPKAGLTDIRIIK